MREKHEKKRKKKAVTIVSDSEDRDPKQADRSVSQRVAGASQMALMQSTMTEMHIVAGKRGLEL